MASLVIGLHTSILCLYSVNRPKGVQNEFLFYSLMYKNHLLAT